MRKRDPVRREPVVTNAMTQSNIASRNSRSGFATTKPSVLLGRAADLIDEHGWMSAYLRSSNMDASGLDVVSAILLASGWSSGWRGQYVGWGDNARTWESQEIDQYLAEIHSSRAARNCFALTMGYVVEVVELEDLTMWNDEYCHDQDEAVHVLRGAAELALLRGD